MSIPLFQIVFTKLENVRHLELPGISLVPKSELPKLHKYHKTHSAGNSMLGEVCYTFQEKLILIYIVLWSDAPSSVHNLAPIDILFHNATTAKSQLD